MSPDKVKVPLKKLPDEVLDGAIAHIRRFCVSMVIADEDETKGLPCSGVLCVLNGIAGILTARHVWRELSGSRKLVLMLGPNQSFRLNRDLLDAKSPIPHFADEISSAEVPDIAFILLPATAKASIEAREKVFYSIDRRAESDEFSLYDEMGFWIAVGCPKALMKSDKRAVGALIYTTDVEKVVEHSGWDYLYVNINLESGVVVPQDLGGMSGGGIWRVRLYMTEGNVVFVNDTDRDILLQGIIFFQTPLASRQLVAHGPRSIYGRMREFMRQ